MDRNREHVGAFVEDTLRAVAVVDVDIEYSDPLVLQLKLSRRDCAVVKKAESACQIAVGVMTGRPAQRVSRILAVHHELGSRGRNISRGTGRSIGAGTDRAPRVGR